MRFLCTGSLDGHIACSSCIQQEPIFQIKNSCRSCPVCLDKAHLKLEARKALSVDHAVQALRYRCQNQECDWTGTKNDKHEDFCPHRMLTCSICHGVGPAPFILGAHETICPRKVISCPRAANGCNWTGRRELLTTGQGPPWSFAALAGQYIYAGKSDSGHDAECKFFACDFADFGCDFLSSEVKVQRHCENYCRPLHNNVKDLLAQIRLLQLKAPKSQTLTPAIPMRQPPLPTSPSPRQPQPEEYLAASPSPKFAHIAPNSAVLEHRQTSSNLLQISSRLKTWRKFKPRLGARKEKVHVVASGDGPSSLFEDF
ncbi:hypothetical protein T439DRAFT_329752 [Meredithblackwellia eburnea MCA 4105]